MSPIPFPRLIGIYSPVPRCGKSTLATRLRDRASSDAQIISFAGPLKAVSINFLMQVTGMSGPLASRYVYRDKNEPIPALNGATGRTVMQRLGRAGRQIDRDLWVRKWHDSASAVVAVGSLVIADDVRAANEAAAVIRLGGEMWHLSRAVAEAEADPDVIADVSEGALADWPFDRYFHNDGAVDELVEAVISDLRTSPPQCRD